MKQNINLKKYTFLLLIYLAWGCKKLISIPPPSNTISTPEAFSSIDQVNSAMAGVYASMINTNSVSLFSGALTIFSGVSSDELINFNQLDQNFNQFQKNTLTSLNPNISGNFWTPAYTCIYQTNAILEGLSNAKNINDSVKRVVIGEAKFIRSFCYFYLINLFGDVPLVTTTNWRNTNLISRSKISEVYKFIISDLLDCENSLATDYSIFGGERIRPTKFAAAALLSRIYLYNKEYEKAEDHSSLVIENSTTYKLDSSLNDVFLLNSSESIWQLKQDNSGPPYNATREGKTIIPTSKQPYVYISSQLINSFESGDQRLVSWIDSTVYLNKKYFFPKKYKIGSAQASPSNPYTEYYMVLRLAEQYLIRAEARARLNKLSESKMDLNIVRTRSSLSDVTTSSADSLVSYIIHERQVELFAEWGHRWLDLKRLDIANSELSPLKPGWTITAQLYPIPMNEIRTDPNLTQNNGYN